MTKASSKSAPKPSAPNNPETETDDDDIFEGGDFVSLSESLEEETVKRDARRKLKSIGKKRLKNNSTILMNLNLASDCEPISLLTLFYL